MSFNPQFRFRTDTLATTTSDQCFTTAGTNVPFNLGTNDTITGQGINVTTATATNNVIVGNWIQNASSTGINITVPEGQWDFTEVGGFKNALMQIFKKVPKDLIKSEDDKKMVIAKEKSEKLLKSWLSPKEYQGLLNEGELEVPSEFDKDTIFIIKRDPNEMVQVKKKGLYTHKLCAVADNLEMPVGDQLLSKLLLLKTDERKFKEIAIQH